MELAPCLKDGFLPQSSPLTRGDKREEADCGRFSRSLPKGITGDTE
jgi:hypothetical protein